MRSTDWRLMAKEFKSVAVLGRQPALGIAELESLYSADAIKPFGAHACFIDLDACAVDFNRLGGSTRVGTVLMQLPSTKWTDIEKLLIQAAPEHAAKAEGKLVFGLSTFGVKTSPKQVAKTALLMKKAIKNSGKSVRMVPHDKTALGSATVLRNKLHRDGNWELLVISDGNTAYLAQTNFMQDIDAYAARDQKRPARDAKVGMLPPKLAQIIINLAVGGKQDQLPVVLDPFCGTGVLLQEALLMGHEVYGTDLEPRMIEYSEKNLSWLIDEFQPAQTTRRIEVADATSYQWRKQTFNTIACETFLGKPLSTLPPSDQLGKIMYEANYINHRFLQNISVQLAAGTRLCIAVPAWRGKREFLHLSTLDHLTDMGYTRLRFKHVSQNDLIYHRENQVVARELVVLIKN